SMYVTTKRNRRESLSPAWTRFPGDIMGWNDMWRKSRPTQKGNHGDANCDPQKNLLPLSLEITGVQGKEIARFLSMGHHTWLYVTSFLQKECQFRKTILETTYIIYSCMLPRRYKPQRSVWICINENGKSLNWQRVKKTQMGAHYLPVVTVAEL
uniref:Uncharacterized protein n=1 Tax=Cyprinus carpio TaxID=7962 RepID=A0A8C1K1Y1_CYPCA